MLIKYLIKIFGFTFRGLVIRTDALQILLAAAFPSIYHIMGWPMPSELAPSIAAYIGYAVGTFLLMRLVAAPYFIWKEDQKKIKSIEDKLLLPDKRAKEQMLKAITKRRIDLIDQVNEITFNVFANELPPEKLLEKMPKLMKTFAFLQAPKQTDQIRQWWVYYLSTASHDRTKIDEKYSVPNDLELSYLKHKDIAEHWRNYFVKSLKMEEFNFEKAKDDAVKLKAKYDKIKS